MAPDILAGVRMGKTRGAINKTISRQPLYDTYGDPNSYDTTTNFTPQAIRLGLMEQSPMTTTSGVSSISNTYNAAAMLGG